METQALWLVEIGNCEPPLLAVIEHPYWNNEDGLVEFTVEENTCPTNLIPAAALIWGDDADPHGVLTFVQQIVKPDDWPLIGEVSLARYHGLFDKLAAYLEDRRSAVTEAA